MASMSVRTVQDPYTSDDKLAVERFRLWLQARVHQPINGCLVVAQLDDGFTLQWFGSIEMDADDVQDYFLSIADELRGMM